jgi:uncharacterized delta-60 repeat protein
MARLYVDGAIDAGFNPNADSTIYSIATQTFGTISLSMLVGGAFDTISGNARGRIARLSEEGHTYNVFDPNANNIVFAIAVQPDSKILVGGFFTAIGGTARNRIARLTTDGTIDAGFNPDADGAVRSIAVQSDGRILIGGSFTSISGTTRNRIARLNADGTLDSGFNPNANNNVYAIAVQADGKILIGGTFTSIGGTTRNRIARLNADGTLDAGFNPNANGSVASIVIQANGGILIGGTFTSIGGTARNRIARLTAGGSLDGGFDPNANNTVNSISALTDGKILLGGDFTTVGGNSRSRIARLSTPYAALQELVANSRDTVSWLRSGAGPELDFVWFERSSNMTSWVPLGAGTRITGGWRITGLGLPLDQNIYLRARGYARGGYFNGSGSIIESVCNVYFRSGMGVGGGPSTPLGDRPCILEQNAPNPVRAGRTTVSFSLPQRSEVSLIIYNALGQKVATIIDGELGAGNHRVSWNGTGDEGMRVSSGVYLYQLRALGKTLTKRMTVVK